MLREAFTNETLILPVLAWTLSQLIKLFVVLLREKRLDLRYLVISGGMPSAHTAFVSSLTTTVAIIAGVGSMAFGIAAVFSLVVMYDAAGVRQSVGQQSVILNRILKELRLHRPMTELGRDIREFIGHTQMEVLVGCLLGIAVALAWFGFRALPG